MDDFLQTTPEWFSRSMPKQTEFDGHNWLYTAYVTVLPGEVLVNDKSFAQGGVSIDLVLLDITESVHNMNSFRFGLISTSIVILGLSVLGNTLISKTAVRTVKESYQRRGQSTPAESREDT